MAYTYHRLVMIICNAVVSCAGSIKSESFSLFKEAKAVILTLSLKKVLLIYEEWDKYYGPL